MIPSVAALLAGFSFRVFQVLVEASLYLLIGFLTAGFLRTMLGRERLRAFFGEGRLSAPLRAWTVAAVLLPVCSLGVLPVIRELRRAGVRRSAVLTFALAAPMLNPVSLMYGASYLGLPFLAAMVGGTLAVSVGAGVLYGLFRPEPGEAGDPPAAWDLPAPGAGRLLAALVHAGRSATGPVMLDLAIGLAGAGAVAALLDPGYLAESTFAGDPAAIARMTAIAPASYLTPDKGIMTLPEMVKFRQSTGAALVLLALGVGMTLGHLSWAARNYGARAALTWAALALGLSAGVGYAVEGLLAPVGSANSDNDHFAALSNGFAHAGGALDLPMVFGKYAGEVPASHWATLAAFAGLIAFGLACRMLGDQASVEAFVQPATEGVDAAPSSRGAIAVPARVVSGLAGAGALAVVAAGAFAYYPDPAETFQDMSIIKADFYGELSSAPDAALHHLELWDRQAAKLAMGARLRLADPGEEGLASVAALRAGIAALRESVAAGRADEARARFPQVQDAHARARKAYLGN